MVFTTQIFLFVFFPVCLFVYVVIDLISRFNFIEKVLKKIRAKEIVIILFSLGFYMWTCFDDVFRLLLYILLVYLLALWLSSVKAKNKYININSDNDDAVVSKGRLYLYSIPFIISIIIIIFVLIYYNYSYFLGRIWNMIFDARTFPESLLAPLGLSFITFSAISYLTDIYRGNATVGSFIDCLFYMTFFPKIVSGPIVLWKDFQPQIKTRKLSLALSSSGINRIMIGFGKKLILADTFGACLADIPLTGIDKITAFGSLILYMLQIYYDFSGYSDIAIGLSNLLGFEFKENFNFPYRATSISEFWRRWHISLGSWFREYVYFPLGGSRRGKKRTLINLAVVFALTGVWHGAGWNYILWGIINASAVIIERIVRNKKVYIKTPTIIKYIFTMAIVLFFWQFFRYESVWDTARILKIIVGNIRFDNIPYSWDHYFSFKIVVFTVIGIIGSKLFGSPTLISLQRSFCAKKIGYIIQEVTLIVVFILSILFMVNSTYSPFIYFQY